MIIIKNFFLITISFCICLSKQVLEAAPQDALTKTLPGFNGTFPSNHYSGYVTLDGIPQKNLFYYFVQSERNSSEDPLVLWLNGGPGCSSFDGFIYEHGPFNFEAAKTKGGLPILHLNPYSWSKVSNVIYLESPSGVGLSYPPLNQTGDLQTAIDTHAFLLKWLELYPEFISNPFYISGESYAGIYVPTLASQVVKGIKSGVKPAINFKGYMIGNGVCDDQHDGNALVPFAHGMGLISDTLYQEALVNCKGNYQNSRDQSCTEVLEKIDDNLDGLNIYDVLEPCYHDNSSENDVKNSSLPQSFKRLGRSNERPLPVRKRMFGRAWPFRAIVKPGAVRLWPELSTGFDDVPCMNDEVATAWLNNQDVRKAIHASPDAGKWSLCGGLIRYIHDAGSMISYHKNLTADGYRALIYSGDHDMCVPFTGTEAWVESLGYQVVEEWRPWISNYQIAGYTQKYAKGLTFLTIKGAGHTVPEYKPRESLDFYSRWLQGQSI